MGMLPPGVPLPADDHCRACLEPIVWAVIESSGKRVPLDPVRRPDEDEYANVALRGDHLSSRYARMITKDEPFRVGERRFVIHFATCTAPRPSRRRRGGNGLLLGRRRRH